MIKIKNYIFNENDVREIETHNKDLMVEFKDGYYEVVENVTFNDIEWNYEYIKENTDEYIALSNNYYRLEKRYKELEEENKQLKELNVCVGCNNSPDYKSRIDKAIKLLKEDYFEDGSGNNVEEVIKILRGE